MVGSTGQGRTVFRGRREYIHGRFRRPASRDTYTSMYDVRLAADTPESRTPLPRPTKYMVVKLTRSEATQANI